MTVPVQIECPSVLPSNLTLEESKPLSESRKRDQSIGQDKRKEGPRSLLFSTLLATGESICF